MMGQDVTRATQWTGLATYLKKYVATHYPNLRVLESFTDLRGAFVKCSVSARDVEYQVRLRVPANAPVGARPLFDSVYQGDKLIWRYSVDYRPNVPWGEQRRIHLYELAGVNSLVYVTAASPVDIIEKVTSINGDDFNSITLVAFLRVHIAKLWGMTTEISKVERRDLARLQIEGLAQKR